ncbi:MAG: hypothetical protein AAB474_02840 [Patescibacteria group bacterium]
MLQEQFHQPNDKREELFNKLPEELRSKHIDDTVEELEEVIEERKKIGPVPDIRKKYRINPKTGTVEKKQNPPDKETWH